MSRDEAERQIKDFLVKNYCFSEFRSIHYLKMRSFVLLDVDELFTFDSSELRCDQRRILIDNVDDKRFCVD